MLTVQHDNRGNACSYERGGRRKVFVTDISRDMAHRERSNQGDQGVREMTCYKDRTYCVLTECKRFKTCESALTEAVKANANRAGMDISQTDEMECFE